MRVDLRSEATLLEGGKVRRYRRVKTDRDGAMGTQAETARAHGSWE